MNASKKATKSVKKIERGLSNMENLAKTANTRRRSKQKKNEFRDREGSYNGGRIDRFPRGNKQGMGFGNKQSIIVQESEYIGEVTSNSTTFSLLTSYPINPGQVSTFPWLSTIAKNYEKYEFLSLQWIYKPEVSQYAQNGQTGKILMCVDYDASDPPPQNKMQMEDIVPHSDAMPYQQLKLNCRPKEMHQNSDAKFIRSANLPGQSDIKTYDAGNLFIGTSGIATNTGVLGELHVKYIVKLSIPVVASQGIPINNSVSQFEDSAGQSMTSSVQIQSTLPITDSNGLAITNTVGALTASPGNYMVFWTANSICSGANNTVFVGILQAGITTISRQETSNAGGATQLEVSGTGFWKSDGTAATALTISGIANFSAGTLKWYPSVIIQSI